MYYKGLYGIFFILIQFSARCYPIPQAAPTNQNIDSLRNLLLTNKTDTVRLRAMHKLSEIYQKTDTLLYQKLSSEMDSLVQLVLDGTTSTRHKPFYIEFKCDILSQRGDYHRRKGNFKKALHYYNEALLYGKKTGIPKKIAGCYNNIGIVYGMQADYKTCKQWMLKSLEIYESLQDQNGLANCYNNLGNIHYYQGDYKPAADYWTKSLKIKEQIGDKTGEANTLNNIGNIHRDQKNYNKALEYYSKSRDIYELIASDGGIIVCSSNMANIFLEMGDFESALELFTEGFKLSEKAGDKIGIADCMNGLGSVYKAMKNFSIAETYFKNSIELNREIGNNKGLSSSLNNLGIILNETGREKEALASAQESLEIGEKIGSLQRIMEASHTLWQINKTIGNSDKALQMHELYVKVKDSLGSENNRMEIIKKEFELQYEKQVAADSIKSSESDKLKDAQISREQAENKQQRVQTYFLLGGLLLTFISGGLFYNRYRLTHRQKKIIELQKSKVDIAYQTLELKNREITDSIKYATRIQHAILPPKKRVAQLLPDSFILFKPKDIVAGDFYWLETADLNSGNADEDTRSTVLLAAADCTGHGVPGAMVSVICNNGLNRAVREHGIKDPGKILDKARTIIIQEFEKSEEEVNDGMDISLCSLTYAGTDGHLSLQWAGANNPLWIFRNNEVIEIKPDKQPIGNYTDSKPFTTHTFQLQKSDTLYIFTDGFQDQFGGEKGKKFKASNLKKLLLSIQHETMTRQLELISEAFEAWKGNLEQNDDVCLIGVRV